MAGDVESLRAKLRELLRRPPRHETIDGVMAARGFKSAHAAATKASDKATPTVQQLQSHIETIRSYVEAR